MIIKEDQLEKLFFTSDQHFFHQNIIKFTNRPYANVSEMNWDLIEKYNNVVPEDGIVFLLGDISFTGNIQKINHIIHSLNGTKYLILGNHDYQNKINRRAILSSFEDSFDLVEIMVEDPEMKSPQKIVMCHYPICFWNGQDRGSWHLYGHIHGGPRTSSRDRLIEDKSLLRYDVGVDNNNYAPISYNELKVKLYKR